MKFKELFENLTIFFSYYKIDAKTKNAFLSLLYSSFSQYEKNKYETDIKKLQEITGIQLNLIDFFKLKKQLDKLAKNNKK